MASEACDICGKEVDADEIDPHGHFAGVDEDDEDEDIVHMLILGGRKDKLACGDDAEDNASSTNRGDVNCTACRAVM